MATKDERTDSDLLRSIDKRLASISSTITFMGIVLLIAIVFSACSAMF